MLDKALQVVCQGGIILSIEKLIYRVCLLRVVFSMNFSQMMLSRSLPWTFWGARSSLLPASVPAPRSRPGATLVLLLFLLLVLLLWGSGTRLDVEHCYTLLTLRLKKYEKYSLERSLATIWLFLAISAEGTNMFAEFKFSFVTQILCHMLD